MTNIEPTLKVRIRSHTSSGGWMVIEATPYEATIVWNCFWAGYDQGSKALRPDGRFDPRDIIALAKALEGLLPPETRGIS